VVLENTAISNPITLLRQSLASGQDNVAQPGLASALLTQPLKAVGCYNNSPGFILEGGLEGNLKAKP
jgi:hypothetical protein